MRRRVFFGWLLTALIACSGDSAKRSEPASTVASTPRRAASLFLTPPPSPEPIAFPQDYGSHDVLTEWWYYTGHLRSARDERFGFEFVVFQVQRFGYPVVYAAHAALSAIDRQTFRWDERLISVPQRPASWPLQLVVNDWELASDGRVDRIIATTPSFSIDLELFTRRPPVLHDEDGYFTWAPATGSYYYSRTRLEAIGRIGIDGETFAVEGLAWHDHQWGNFILGPGGWDWFALQLDDGTDLMVWQSRDAEQRVTFQSGTLVDSDGRATRLVDDTIDIVPLGSWVSPHTGAIYPSGWQIELAREQLRLTVSPLIFDQELQALRSTGTIYWEGAVSVNGVRAGQVVRGQGYVELTGYASTQAGS